MGSPSSIPAASAASLANSGGVAALMRWAGLAGIAGVAALRCLIVFAPQVAFDVDPGVDPTSLSGVGPGGSLLLDAILLASCALAILGEWRSGRGIDLRLMVLALAPAPVLVWHGWNDGLDLWRGMTWVSAALAAATAAHLARDRAMRALLLALLAGVIAPILIRGVSQITVEHADMMRLFEARRDEFLAARGWDPDSSAARIYERRLRQPQPLGWFATSNIFAALAATGLVLWAGLSIAAYRARLASGWPAAMALLAMACAAMLWMTGSKGAVLAALVGTGLLLAAVAMPRVGQVVRRHPGRVVLALIALALLAVMIRGVLLPESFANERSLLFRWHYMTASARMFMDSPLAGVGPDGYQAAYTLFRAPRNPEEVMSAHSMFLDWICTLGVSAFAWIALLTWLLAPVPGQPDEPAADEHQASQPRRLRFFAAGSAAAVACIGVLIEAATLDPFAMGIRVLGALAFLAAALLTLRAAIAARSFNVDIALIASVAVLLMHSQIEMTFHQPGAVTWAWLMIAGVSPGSAKRALRAWRWSGPSVALVVAGLAFWIGLRDAIPALRQEARMAEAASALGGALRSTASHAQMLHARRAAARQLVEAYEIWPRNPLPLDAAAIQLELACAAPGGPEPMGLLLEAQEIIDRAILAHGRPASIAIAASIAARLAGVADAPESWAAAIAHARALAERDPNGIGAWRRLGDVLWAAGAIGDAATAYRRALRNDANSELDDLKRMSDRDRALVQRRVEESTAE